MTKALRLFLAVILFGLLTEQSRADTTTNITMSTGLQGYMGSTQYLEIKLTYLVGAVTGVTLQVTSDLSAGEIGWRKLRVGDTVGFPDQSVLNGWRTITYKFVLQKQLCCRGVGGLVQVQPMQAFALQDEPITSTSIDENVFTNQPCATGEVGIGI